MLAAWLADRPLPGRGASPVAAPVRCPYRLTGVAPCVDAAVSPGLIVGRKSGSESSRISKSCNPFDDLAYQKSRRHYSLCKQPAVPTRCGACCRLIVRSRRG